MAAGDAQYLVMRVKDETAILLSDDGAFVEVPLTRIPADAHRVGATTGLRELVPVGPAGARPQAVGADTTPGRVARRLPEWTRWLASAAAIVLMLWGGTAVHQVWAYPYHLAVDINPSVVLVFDRKAELHDIRPRNPEAVEFLTSLALDQLRGASPADAVKTLLEGAYAGGYLSATELEEIHDELPSPSDDAANLIMIGIHRQWRAELPETLEPSNLGQQVREVATQLQVDTVIVAQTVEGVEWRTAERRNVSPNPVALGWDEQPAPGPERVQALKDLTELIEAEPVPRPRQIAVFRSNIQPPGLSEGGPPGLSDDGPPGAGPPGASPGNDGPDGPEDGPQPENGEDPDPTEGENGNGLPLPNGDELPLPGGSENGAPGETDDTPGANGVPGGAAGPVSPGGIPTIDGLPIFPEDGPRMPPGLSGTAPGLSR